MKNHRSLISFLPFLIASPAACGGDAPAPVTAANAGGMVSDRGAAPSAPAAKKPMPPPSAYENPGGMWMPHQMAAHEKQLKDLGLAIDPKNLTDPLSPVLGAIVSLGGCSATFVSEEGLVITNHHCATQALQFNSTPQDDISKNGFLAKTRADEKSNGPTARVFVTRAVTDVTKDVREGLDKLKDDHARFKAVQNKEKELVAKCEKDRPGTRCNVSKFFEGASYYLIEQLEIRDVRLVYAPHKGVGNYGGEVDNWRWPRHTGDVSIFRAYVSKDGKPADFSKDNVPYKPPHFMKLAKEGIKQGDLVFVAGYPGRTNLLKTAAEVEEAVNVNHPRRRDMFEAYLALFAELGKTDKEIELKAMPTVRSYGNTLTNTKGQLEGLTQGGLLAKKQEKEKALREFIAKETELTKKSMRTVGGEQIGWGNVLDKLAEEMKSQAKFREANAQNGELMTSKLLSTAMTIVRMAEERPKADKDRDPDYQERNFQRHEQAFQSLDKRYNEKLDKETLKLALTRALKKPAAERTAAVEVLVGKGAKEEAVPAAAEALYKGTKLADAETRLDLLKNGTTKSLAASKDTFIQLALKMRPLVKAAEDRAERSAGRMAVLKPIYFEALKAFEGREIAPDANSTLRITYGTVKGYAPKEDARPYLPFTVLSEVVAKNTGKDPFDAPKSLVDAYQAKKFGPYVDPYLGEVPVDFLTDLHITGGNSGSGTFNAKGELVGLAFDGNYESLASDWYFVPKVTRSIHVDVRYIAWLLDAVDGGDHILKELGVQAAL